MTAPSQASKAASKPWYSFLGTHEFIGGVAIVTSWITSLPKITWHDALGGLGGLLAAFGVGRSNSISNQS